MRKKEKERKKRERERERENEVREGSILIYVTKSRRWGRFALGEAREF